MNVLFCDYPQSMDESYAWQKAQIERVHPDAVVRVVPYASPQQFQSALAEADALVTAFLPLTREVLAGARRLRIVSLHATGYGTVNLAAAKELGITVTNVVDYCTTEVAEHTMALLLALARHLKAYDQHVQERYAWQFETEAGLHRLAGRRLMLFGWGRISRTVARLAQAFGLAVGVVSHHLSEAEALGRENVFAYVRGTKAGGDASRAILWHGHIDTVGTEDFGALEPYATEPDELLERLLAGGLPEAVRTDLATGDWMPGRGACDMKSGDAVFLVLLKHLSEHTDTFAGTVVLSLNCVEENEHTGILRGLDVLDDLRERLGLRYLFAINNDYTCPLYDGDPHRYLYAGAVGKLLPCVYIRGCETHVGQCFEGFDASVAAADVVQAVNYNTELCDGYRGEYTLPPSVLKMKDLKPSYNVQTAQEAWTYFNVFVHAKSAADVLEEFLDITRNAMQHVAKRIDNEATQYARLSQQPVLPPTFKPLVMSYEELVAAVKKKRAAGRSDALPSAGQGSDASDNPATLEEELERMAIELRVDRRNDLREISLALVRKLAQELAPTQPLAVVFFAAPYCPANTLRQENAEEAALYKKIATIAADVGKETGDDFRMLRFFPSLSDSSYLKIDDTPASVAALYANLPGGKKVSPVPTERIRKTGIPAIDYGVYGKDAHKWTERVYKPYSFRVLPRLILKTVEKFL